METQNVSETTMNEGKVKFYNADKGFGFITKPDGVDIFFHISSWNAVAEPQGDERVKFDVEQGNKGPVATNIELLGE